MSKRRIGIIAAATATVAVAAGIGAGTFAAFTDTEVSDAATVTAGTLNLTVEAPLSSDPNTFDAAAPGDELGIFMYELVNAGSVDGDAAFSLGYTADDDVSCVGPEEDVDDTCGAGQDGELDEALIAQISVDMGATWVEIDDAELLIPGGETKTVKLKFTVSEDAGNEIQSDTVGVELTVTLDQA